tara:strand:+ start:513 stop:1328 length:816 start_codon:yes stop_codon:yes gene_type:complete
MKKRILTLGTIRDYILEYFPDTLWWDGFHKWETFNPSRSYKHRHGMPNEIRIEFDYEDNRKNWEAINFTAIKLNKLGYSFAIYYVEGGRGPHLHIYDLDELEQLDYEQRTIYRQKFLTKICGKYEADKALCDEKHMCALEFAHHFKHKKPKQLLSYFWNGRNMGIDIEIKLNILHGKKPVKQPKKIQRKLKFGELLMAKPRALIIDKCEFEKVLDKYGIKHRGHMAQCPFHNDTNYSLSFNNDNGLWKCFGTGCESKGDIITLIKRLRELK